MNLQPINVLSLFDGMSCGRIALERAGIPVNNYYASEIDKYAMKVSAANYPDIIQLGSVTELKNIDWNNPKIDLLIGGSPCQGFSFAGKQLNFEDPRSKLFFEFVRVLEEIRLINPNVKFFLENVKMKKEYQDVISELLGVQPIEVDSSTVSAQQRKRLYWTNIATPNFGTNATVLSDIMEEEVDEKYFYNYELLNLDLSKQVCAIMDYKNNDTHKRILNPKFKSHTLTCCRGGNTQKKVYDNGRARKLTPLEYERLQTVPDNYTAGISESQRYNSLGNGWTIDVIAEFFKNMKSTTGPTEKQLADFDFYTENNFETDNLDF